MILTSTKLAGFSHATLKSMAGFLLYAEDQGLVDFFQNKLLAKLGRTAVQKITQDDLIAAKRSLADLFAQQNFFEKEKDFIVQNCSEKGVRLIVDYIETQPRCLGSRFLFFQADYLKPASKLRKVFETEKTLLALPCYKPDRHEIALTIQDRFAEITPTKFSKEALHACVDLFQDTLSALESGLEILSQYAWGKASISAADVREIFVAEHQGHFEDFLQAFLARDKKTLQLTLRALFQDGHTVISQLRLVSFYMQRFLNLLVLLKRGLSYEEANRKIPMPFNFFQEKFIRPQTKNWTLDQCFTVLDRLRLVETLLKKRSFLSPEDLCMQELIMLLDSIGPKSKNMISPHSRF